ncbi:TOBE domain-containing protein [Dyella nitratireducens]|uniref:ModE family transcriptional regulator n=1 Tax=Dyella nitratireducens TaxID=1849580 RepID=A0ABQ1GPT6_9GAMM|nr:TOBE domain-containing protein [Dyella nitratireducens]GGA48087.1 ModE family transcriptional regulator [Dyella nitratireducens]GLQ42363.1 ModE family transcriptional regulator [Dyella nitratireducens]
MFKLKGILSLQAGDQTLGGADRVALLAKIKETGSITAAARAVGMSYKGAWDAIDAMNNLADEPLVTRAAGGKGGGGTRLTERGQRLIETFAALEEVHRRFLEQFETLAEASADDIKLIRSLMFRTSARNQLSGHVVAIHKGVVNDTVELKLPGGEHVVATLTCESTENLGLKIGSEAIALIKASSVLLALPDEGMRLSARNQFPGTIVQIVEGPVNADVRVRLTGGSVMAAVVTTESVSQLGLKEGVPVVAVVKASSVMLGTTR